MTACREALVDRMIAVYGYEHPIVLNFAELAEVWRGDEKVLHTLVASHESCPQY